MARRPPSKRHPDRRSLEELVEDLREEATDLAQDLNGIPAHETTYGEAAQALVEFEAALTQIAAGASDAPAIAAIAADALSLAKPLAPIKTHDDDEADTPLRDLLKPRRS